MDSEIKTGPDVLETFDYDTLNVEDCQYILRSLERRAFEHVVCALRAQGPLSEYKEVILDHLKALFFISDDDFLLHLRLCANDPVLSKVAEKLNPSYDSSSEWLASGYNVMLFDFPKMVQLNTSVPNKTTCSMAEQMRLQMAQHNSRVDDECQAMLKLIRLKKKPYVPEKLRRLLRDTENDAQNRVDVLKDKSKSSAKTAHRVGRPPRRFESAAADSTSSKTKPASKMAKIAAKAAKLPVVRSKSPAVTPTVEAFSADTNSIIEVPSESVPSTSAKSSSTAIKANTRPTRVTASKAAVTVVKDEPAAADFAPAEKLSSPKPPTVFNAEPAPACTPEPSTAAPNAVDVQPDKSPPINGAAVQQQQQQVAAQRPIVKAEEIENHKAVDEFSIHYSGGANVVVVDPEDQNTTKEPKVRKRRSKMIDDVTCTCARVHPFTFEPAVGDIPKPPRGNPDKRCSKLKTSKRSSGSNDLNTFNYIPQQPLATNYYPQKNVSYYNSAPAASDIHPLKRSRTSSMHDEANLLFQKPIHHPRVMNTPLNVLTTPSYSGTSRPPYYGGGGGGGQQTSPMMMGATPSYAPANEYEVNYVDDHYYSSSAPTRVLAPQPSHVVDGDIVIAGYAPAARSDVMMEDTYGGVEPALYAKDTRPGHLPVTSSPVVPKSTYRRYVSREVVDSKQLMSSNSSVSESGSRQAVEHSPSLNASRSLPNVEQTMDNAQSVSTPIMTSSMMADRNSDPSQSTTSATANGGGNATGLDFLASTASLLIPMQTAEPQAQEQTQNFYVSMPDQSQQQPLFRDNPSSSYVNVTSAGPPQPQQIIYVQSVPSAPSMQESSQVAMPPTTVSITYYTTEASPVASLPTAATSGTENLILPGRSLQESTSWPMQPPLTTIASGSVSYIPSVASNHAENVEHSSSQTITQIAPSTSVATTTFSSSAPPQQQKAQFTDNEAAQNFLKQHASLVDTNGLPLNEELTLGSIIRSSNLRNKLFSTASKSSASPSPSANSPSAIPTTASAVNASTLPSTTFSVLPSQLATTTFSASAPMSCGDSAFSHQAMSGVSDQKVQNMYASLPYSTTTQSVAGEIALSAPQNSAAAVTTTAVNASLVNRPN